MLNKKHVLIFLLAISLLGIASGCSGAADESVTVSQLVAQANRYNGKVVTLDAFFFYAPPVSDTLADSVMLDSSTGKVIPVGAQIRTGGNILPKIQNQLYIQDSPSSHFGREYFGKLRITGKFEIDDKDGQYRVTVSNADAEVLEWTPPQAETETPNGNLQIVIETAGGQPLEGVKVVSESQPDGQLKVSGITNANGTATFNDIKQGAYLFTVSLADYAQMDIKVTVTGGRTVNDAFSMARVGEAPDDFVPAPGLGPQYRGSGAAVRRDGTYVIKPWPPIQQAEVTLGTSPDAVQINYRDYIETEAGQVRNNMVIISQSGPHSDDPELDAALSVTGLSSGITVTEAWEWGRGKLSKTGLQIVIPQDVPPGEYAFSIDVQINGEDYGTVPCTIIVLP